MVQTWVIGVMINLCGSIMINFGTNVLKYSHIQAQTLSKKGKQAKSNSNPEKRLPNIDSDVEMPNEPNSADEGTEHVSGTYSRLWYLGFTVFVVGNVMNFVSFSLATQSLLAGLGSIQFLTNVFFAYLLFGAPITRSILMGTLIILMGNSLVVAFANQSSNSYSAQELMELYGEPVYHFYLLGIVLVAFALHNFHMFTVDKIKRSAILRYRLLNPRPLPEFYVRSVPVSYAVVSGMLGTQSVILAKSCSDLLRSTWLGENQFAHPFTYAVVAMWLCAIVFWLKRMNIALRRFDAVFIIPFLQVNWIVFSIVGGGLYFQEFEGFSNLRMFLFFLGVFLILVGVFLLTPETSAAPAKELEDRHRSTLVHRKSVIRARFNDMETNAQSLESQPHSRRLSTRLTQVPGNIVTGLAMALNPTEAETFEQQTLDRSDFDSDELVELDQTVIPDQFEMHSSRKTE